MPTIQLCAVLGLTGACLGGPIWPEPNTDAGSLPDTASTPDTFPNGPTTAVVRIRGELTGTNEDGPVGDFQDMYKIEIADVSLFSATAMGRDGMPIVFDSQLFLFDEAGTPILTNDNDPAGGIGSALFSPGTDGTVIPGPGIYFIAISGVDSDPTSSAGIPLFPSSPGTGVVGPISSTIGPIGGWTGPGAIGKYDIFITGLVIPAPGAAVFGLLALAAMRRRSR